MIFDTFKLPASRQLRHWLLAAGALAVAGCAQFGPNAEGIDASGGGGGRGGEDDPGAGGHSELVVGPEEGGGADPRKPYAHLCGTGCSTWSGEDATCVCRAGGDPSDCAQGGNVNPDSAQEGGSPSPDAPPDTHQAFCQLVATDTGAEPVCRIAGEQGAGDPCANADDCGPALGCVASSTGSGICRQYCCDDVELCPGGTFCAPRAIAESVASSAPVEVPVCVTATPCELLNDATCPEGLTCGIVRADGTTSCVAPGTGKAHEPCPCAAGHVCSKLTNECKKLCHVGQDATDCDPGAKCQGGSLSYPDGYGICVDGSKY